jgi:hypothetical protein
MTTKIREGQIQAATRGLVTAWSISEQLNLPPLNQSQINALGTPAYGTLVYNSTEDMAQIYKADANAGNPGWDDVGGGGPSLGEGSIIRTNGTTIQENITIGPVFNGGAEFTNGFTAGPIEIANGFTVTIETDASWTLLGDDDLSYAQFVDITSGHITSTGILHFSETKESITYYNSSGNVTHDFNDNNVIWINKTGGGNFTLSLNNVPYESCGYGITVIVYDMGGSGLPSGLNINGNGHTILWAGGSQPGQDKKVAVCSFAIINQQYDTQPFTVLGSGGNYDVP